MKPDGSQVTQLTFDKADDSEPSWSPDGSEITFQSSRNGTYQIFILNPSTGDLQQVTSSDCNDHAPTWSPDGEQIAFYSDCDGNREIYTVGLDGSNRRQLTSTSRIYNWYPTWSPDRETIIYASNASGGYKIYSMDVNGADSTPIATGCQAVFSPDGQTILMSESCVELGSLLVTDADGGNERTLLENYVASRPSWSPDGRQIVFQSDLRDNSEIWVFDLDQMQATRLTYGTSDDESPAWQP